jgi:simple sugar transport system permease protein
MKINLRAARDSSALQVALVGRNHPIGVILAALFFATLSQGGLAIHAFVPKQMVEVLQGVVIIRRRDVGA